MHRKLSQKTMACIMLFSLFTVLLIGCTKGADGNKGQDEAGVVTITTVRGLGGDTVFKNGDTIENNWHIHWIKEKLGINLKYNWVVTNEGDAYNTKLNMMLASGEPMPDVFFINDKRLMANFIESGKVMDISEAFDKYASQRLKDVYDKYPEIWSVVSKGGKKFGMPFFTGVEPTSVMWIRQDWLDKLQLKAPETIEQFEQVMDAFVNLDPDGNGKKDTVGFSLSLKGGLTAYMSDVSFLSGALGAPMPTYWFKGADGKLQYGSTDPTNKKVLSKLNEWYKKGYIDKEAALYSEDKAAESFIQGKSGIIFGSWWLPIWPIGDTVINNPKAVMKPYPVPSGADGKRGIRGMDNFAYALMFNKDFKHIDKMFEYIEEMYGYPFDDPNSDFKYGFQENYDYVMVDGKPSFDKSIIPGGYIEAQKYTLFQNFLEVPGGLVGVYDRLVSGKEPETPAEMRQGGEDPLVIQAGSLIFKDMPYAVYDLYQGAPTETQVKKGELLDKLEQEAFIEIIYGSKNVNYFDEFVREWKANGGDQVTKEVNDAFAESQSK